MKLYVGNLPPAFSDQDLENLFVECGTVISAKVIVDRETGRTKGFGFVEMSSEEEGQKAIEKLDKKVVGKGSIVVNKARPPEKKEFGSFRRNDRNDRNGGGGRGPR